MSQVAFKNKHSVLGGHLLQSNTEYQIPEPLRRSRFSSPPTAMPVVFFSPLGRSVELFRLSLTSDIRRQSSAIDQEVWPVSQCLRTSQTGSADVETDTSFPANLPKPEDDGACDHLTGFELPSLLLPTSKDESKKVDLSALPGLTICFIYPRTGAPGEVVPDSWNAIPGARG